MQDLGLVPTESPNLPYPEGAWADFIEQYFPQVENLPVVVSRAACDR